MSGACTCDNRRLVAFPWSRMDPGNVVKSPALLWSMEFSSFPGGLLSGATAKGPRSQRSRRHQIFLPCGVIPERERAFPGVQDRVVLPIWSHKDSTPRERLSSSSSSAVFSTAGRNFSKFHKYVRRGREGRSSGRLHRPMAAQRF